MRIPLRLSALRTLMKNQGLHAYLIPSTDPHQSEYVPLLWRRREWISGFTGSAGDVAVTLTKAAMWTDGRYFLQAENQLAGSGIALMKLGMPNTPTIALWLGKQLKKGQRVGVDPRVLSFAQFQKIRSDLNGLGITLVSIECNLVDELWADRPPAPDGQIEVHSLRFTGERFQDKLKHLRKTMAEAGTKAHVVAALDQIAWLFNIRGSDVQYNPLVIAYGIVTDKKAVLYTDLKKVTPELRRSLGKSAEIKDYSAFRAGLLQLSRSGQPVWMDPSTTNQWIVELLGRKVKLLFKESPIVLMKAAKNAVEIRGMKQAHIRDGVAMVKFLCWFEQAVGKEKLTEISVADKLEQFRAKSKLFRGLSFDTIIGYAAHGAIIHYSATSETDIPVRKKGLMIVDSGGQYPDGTTDITRTLLPGAPSPEQKNFYTRVLKGHIAVATTSFPVGTSGRQLDTLARRALWDSGVDYGHGTGHGVGAYLSVHEGPQSISPTKEQAGTPLLPGMVISNEPGYYKAGEYGIRIENLVYITKDAERSNRDKTFLKFENLTLCPIETRLIDTRLLTKEEIRYFNAYHAKVRRTLTRFLDKKEAAWLAKATRPIK
ncbi:aminopeptidase P family protein [candidate division KSB1 bacterium]|nr:MAG: aminopeptidase P family protein [candidate division KSB1 bacterium]